MKINFIISVLVFFLAWPSFAQKQKLQNKTMLEEAAVEAWKQKKVPDNIEVLEVYTRSLIEISIIPGIATMFKYEIPDAPYNITILPNKNFIKSQKQKWRPFGFDERRREKNERNIYELLGFDDPEAEAAGENDAAAAMYYTDKGLKKGGVTIPPRSFVIPLQDQGATNGAWTMETYLHALTHEVMHFFQFQSPSLKDTALIKAWNEGWTDKTYDEVLVSLSVLEGHANLAPFIFYYTTAYNNEYRMQYISDDIQRTAQLFEDHMLNYTMSDYLSGVPYTIGTRYVAGHADYIESFDQYPRTTEHIFKGNTADMPENIPENFWGEGFEYQDSMWIGHAFVYYLFCKLGFSECKSTSDGWDGVKVWLTKDDILVLWSAWDSERDAFNVHQGWSRTQGTTHKKIEQRGKHIFAVFGFQNNIQAVNDTFNRFRHRLDE